jgi:hypothetical protein
VTDYNVIGFYHIDTSKRDRGLEDVHLPNPIREEFSLRLPVPSRLIGDLIISCYRCNVL